MMIALLALLLQQPPTLTPTAAQELPERDRTALGVSPSGKYVVIVEPERLEVRDATTLVSLKEIAGRWTAFGFDEREERLLAVGDKVSRFLTKDWSLQLQADLPDAKFDSFKPKVKPVFDEKKYPLVPGQALVLSDLDFYYCTSDGGLSLGSVSGGKLDAKPMNFKSDIPIGRVFGQLQNSLIVAIERRRPATALRGKVYPLMGCSDPFVAMDLGNIAACVGAEEEAIYAYGSWKVLISRSGLPNRCAAFDGKTGWVFVGDDQGLRAWHKDKFNDAVRIDTFKEGVVQIGVDAPRRALVALEKKTIRRWTLSD